MTPEVIAPAFALVRDHYYLKHPTVFETIEYNGRTFFSKYERINSYLSDTLIQKHLDKKITIATAIPDNAEYFVMDYNGDESDLFFHRAAKVLHKQGIDRFEAYESKTPGHLHLYVHCGAISAEQREELGKIISNMLEEKIQKQWRIYPKRGLPEAYNILNIPYKKLN